MLSFLVSNTISISRNHDISLNKVNDISLISEKDFDNNFKGQIFYQDINKIKNINEFVSNNQNILLAKYFYKSNNCIQLNKIYGTQYTTLDQLNKTLNSVKEKSINNDLPIKTKKISTSNWNLYKSEVVIKLLDSRIQSNNYDSWRYIHLGDLFEYVNSYYVETDNFYYTLVTHETYITPNYNEDVEWYRYWPYQLIYNFNNNGNENIRIERYNPISKGKSIYVSYNSSFSIGVGLDGVSIKASVSSNYTTVMSSPEISNKGSIVEGIGKTIFTYMNGDQAKWKPYDNSVFKNYITNTSFQTSMQIYRTSKSKSSKYKFIQLNDKNEVSMLENLNVHSHSEGVSIDWFYEFPHFGSHKYYFNYESPKYIMVSEDFK